MLKRAMSLLAIVMMVAATNAVAGQWEHNREGFLIGFNAGGGGAALELEPQNGGTISTDRTGGGAGNFRLGYAVQPNLTLGFETNAWARNESATIFGQNVDTTYRVQVASFAATYWPGNNGFFLRGGIGVGTGTFEVASGNSTAEAKESGLGLLGAIGYEWRLTQKFAIGPQLDFGYLNLGTTDTTDDDGNDVTADYSVNYFNLSVGFNWYW